MIKRLVDIIISVIMLALVSPLLGLIAVAIKIDSSGPIVFRQQRVGRYGKNFTIHKFRTMYLENSGVSFTIDNDPRITAVGRFLRHNKLDELPQLFDVIRGTMSLVGPRPEVPNYVELWPDELRAVILGVCPGITDPVSITLRNESVELLGAHDPQCYYTQVLLPLKAAGYLEYVQNRSMAGDMHILFRTIVAVIRS